MNIIEQTLVGKHSAAACEDGVVTTPDFVAVIDGSTSKTAERVNPAMRNGRYCMELVAEFIRTVDKDVSLTEFCTGVTAYVHRAYDREEVEPQKRLCASVVVYSRQRHEIWMIGDCQCMVDGTLYENGKPYEAEVAADRAAIFGQMEAEHLDMTADGHIVHDYARDHILPRLIASMDGENKTYAVVDGFPIYIKGVRLIHLDGRQHEVVLASDGYPRLCATLAESEAALRRQLADDPFCISSFKATKGLMQGNVSFDDRAYIRFTTDAVHRYLLWTGFDGTRYHGWQVQPNGESVQEVLQQKLSLLLRQPIEVTGAGRTDAGVHARRMACHFDIDRTLDAGQLHYRLNRMLPRDICCYEVREVPLSLHARFSATSRTYRYFIHTQKDPFLNQYSVLLTYPLDFDRMNEAAQWLLTVDDFKAFCKAGSDVKTTLCHVTQARWVSTSPSTWYFEITANRFLRNMVRAVVGTLIDVGRGRTSIAQFKQIVSHGTRSQSGESMPAKGLFLWKIAY